MDHTEGDIHELVKKIFSKPPESPNSICISFDNYTLKEFTTESFQISKSSTKINYKILNSKKTNLNSKSSAYIEIYENSLFIITGNGVIGFNNLKEIDKKK